MRIVSLLPSTTEILFAIGAGDDVVGVTFECDHPLEARSRRIVSSTALPEGLSPREIDASVAAALARGDDLYRLDAGALSGLDADLVVTQDLCAVCAVDVSVVSDALAHLGCTAEVLTVDPHTLDEVLESVLTLGAATGHPEEASALVASLHDRLDAVRLRPGGRAGAGRLPRLRGGAAGRHPGARRRRERLLGPSGAPTRRRRRGARRDPAPLRLVVGGSTHDGATPDGE